MNVLLDSTIGLTIVYFMLKGSASYFHKRKMILFYSGEYGPGTQYRVSTGETAAVDSRFFYCFCSEKEPWHPPVCIPLAR